ncbi:hypothetical protein [Stenotrophomonas forensis]|uniref:hypothetical protein n=1 Tax=Stenotrophomonas forensis TaxID=2871169 RepID=UPI0039C73A3E
MSTTTRFVSFNNYTVRVDHISAVSDVVKSGEIPSMQYQVHIIVNGYTMTEYFASEDDAYAEAERIAKAMGVYAA